MKSRWSINNKGLTLIEIIIAIAILGVLVVSFLTMFSQGFGSIFTEGHKTEASRLAQEYMDEYFTNPDLGAISNESVGSLTVSSSINTSGPYGTKVVTVTVYYRNGSRNTSITAVVP